MADTGAVIALIDADDRHHEALRAVFEREPDLWVLPWAILPVIAERLDAQAIATLDLRDFASVELAGHPALWPRDL